MGKINTKKGKITTHNIAAWWAIRAARKRQFPRTAHCLGLKVVRGQEKWVWSPAGQRGFLVGPTLPGTCIWVIPSYPKSFEVWKGREGERSALGTTHRICLGLHWFCEENLPVLNLQCRALAMLPFRESQARDALMKCARWAQATSRDVKGWSGCNTKSLMSSFKSSRHNLECLIPVNSAMLTLQLTFSFSRKNILWLIHCTNALV